MTEGDDPRALLAELVRDTRTWLGWLEDSGLDEQEVADLEVVERLAVGPPRAPRGAPPRSAPTTSAPRTGSAPATLQSPAPAVAPAPVVAPPVVAAPQDPPSRPTAEGAVDDPAERRRRLAVLAEEVKHCTKCRLHESRTHTAFSRGSPDAELVFVGEGPGAEEDRQGIPFVGAAGQLLDKMIVAMGFQRDEVYVCNIVKCRPPKNRKPEPDEVEACAPYLVEQLSLIRPKAMVALGATGVQGLIGTTMGITRLRGTWKLYRGRIPLMPTFHPAYLLRQPEKKREVWADLQQVMQRLGKTPPPPPPRGTPRRRGP
ncbi:MAG: uracil-DNA glycosylase [Polyangiaceae bacterium]